MVTNNLKWLWNKCSSYFSRFNLKNLIHKPWKHPPIFFFLTQAIESTPTTLRILTQMNIQEIKIWYHLPSLTAVWALLNLYFYIWLTYSTSLTIFPMNKQHKNKMTTWKHETTNPYITTNGSIITSPLNTNIISTGLGI